MLETIGVYTALECVTERILGTKSIWTNALAGCGAGLAFGAKKGPMVGATSGLAMCLNSHVECSSCYEKETVSLEYHPHLFLNERGEYECSILETNRIRALLGLRPLEIDDE